jgi:hypothetical protein
MIRQTFSAAQATRLGTCIALCILLCGCGSQVMFQSNFSAMPVNQPPAQTVGTANVDGPPGSVIVIPSPDPATSGNLVQVSLLAGSPRPAAFQGNLVRFGGDGSYTFQAAFYVPGPGIDAGRTPYTSFGSVQFEGFGQPVTDYSGFMHLDFVQDDKGNNRVRIDDRAGTEFGMFPYYKPFVMQVTLTIGEAPTAHVTLIGNGASGDADYTIAFPDYARRFGAVRLWLGTQSGGSMDATDIIVARKGCLIYNVLSSIRCQLPQKPVAVKAIQ